jgi:hypothetical protein
VCVFAVEALAFVAAAMLATRIAIPALLPARGPTPATPGASTRASVTPLGESP